MREHVDLGAQIIAEVPFLRGVARDVVTAHHERFDGRGYPSGLRGEQIPLAARIFAVVDAFDAMTNDRPYRRAASLGVGSHGDRGPRGRAVRPGRRRGVRRADRGADHPAEPGCLTR